MDLTTNYCGMYYSDGKLQSSVANGSSEPVNALDGECRVHDAAYANALSDMDRDVADTKFYNNTRGLGVRGRLYGGLVVYGNKLLRSSVFRRAMGNFDSKVGPEMEKRHEWLRGSAPKPTAPGSSDSELPDASDGSRATCYYDGDGFETATVQTRQAGRTIPMDSLNTNYPFTGTGLYKPLGRRKRKRVVPLTDAEKLALLTRLSQADYGTGRQRMSLR